MTPGYSPPVIRRRWAALAAALVVGSGCGSGNGSATDVPTTSTSAPVTTAMPPQGSVSEEIEQELAEGQKRSTPDLAVGAATCPETVPATPGASFECSVDVEGVAVPFRVTLAGTSDPLSGGDSQFLFEQAPPLIQVSTVVARITDELKRQGHDVAPLRVDCGPAKVRVLAAGGGFDCALSGGGPTQTVRVTVQDDKGSLTFRTAP